MPGYHLSVLRSFTSRGRWFAVSSVSLRILTVMLSISMVYPSWSGDCCCLRKATIRTAACCTAKTNTSTKSCCANRTRSQTNRVEVQSHTQSKCRCHRQLPAVAESNALRISHLMMPHEGAISPSVPVLSLVQRSLATPARYVRDANDGITASGRCAQLCRWLT